MERVEEFEMPEEHARAECCVVGVFSEYGLSLGGCVCSNGAKGSGVVCDEEMTDSVVVLHALAEVQGLFFEEMEFDGGMVESAISPCQLEGGGGYLYW